MERQTIAVDVDNVLAGEAEYFIDYGNEHWGHSLSLEDYQENWSEMWGVDEAETERRALELHSPGVVSSYRRLERAHEVLGKLANHYGLVVVTSRRAIVQEETEQWLLDNFGDIFSDIRYTGFYDDVSRVGRHGLTKGGILVEIGADYLIDDQPKHCLSAVDVGLKAILFGDSKIVRQSALPEKVTRCKNWVAVGEYFDGNH